MLNSDDSFFQYSRGESLKILCFQMERGGREKVIEYNVFYHVLKMKIIM